MSTAAPAPPGARRPALVRPAASWPLFPGLARSEWTKLRTLRSTYWALLAAVVTMPAFGAVLTAAYVRHGGAPVRLALSWGSAVGTSQDSEIYSSIVTLPR